MSTATKLSLLAQTKESQRIKLGLATSVPFSAYVNHIPKWSPVILFAGTEQGVLYDSPLPPSLFQDAMASTSVSMDGDQVGLRLDRSRGLASVIVDVPTANISSPISLSRNAIFNLLSTPNTHKGLLRIEIDVSGDFSYLTLVIDGNFGLVGEMSRAGKYVFTVYNLTPTNSAYANLYIKANTNAQTFMINSFVVKKIYGNHAIQTSSSARPIYKTDGAKAWLYHDNANKKMTVKLPAMTATTVVATDDGVVINYPVTIAAGDYVLQNNSTLGREYGRLIIDRELSANEQMLATNYFNAKR